MKLFALVGSLGDFLTDHRTGTTPRVQTRIVPIHTISSQVGLFFGQAQLKGKLPLPPPHQQAPSR